MWWLIMFMFRTWMHVMLWHFFVLHWNILDGKFSTLNSVVVVVIDVPFHFVDGRFFAAHFSGFSIEIQCKVICALIVLSPVGQCFRSPKMNHFRHIEGTFYFQVISFFVIFPSVKLDASFTLRTYEMDWSFFRCISNWYYLPMRVCGNRMNLIFKSDSHPVSPNAKVGAEQPAIETIFACKTKHRNVGNVNQIGTIIIIMKQSMKVVGCLAHCDAFLALLDSFVRFFSIQS